MEERLTKEEIDDMIEEFNKIEEAEVRRIRWYDDIPKFLGMLGAYNLWMFALEEWVFDGIVTSSEMLRGGALLILTAVITWLILFRSRSRK